MKGEGVVYNRLIRFMGSLKKFTHFYEIVLQKNKRTKERSLQARVVLDGDQEGSKRSNWPDTFGFHDDFFYKLTHFQPESTANNGGDHGPTWVPLGAQIFDFLRNLAETQDNDILTHTE